MKILNFKIVVFFASVAFSNSVFGIPNDQECDFKILKMFYPIQSQKIQIDDQGKQFICLQDYFDHRNLAVNSLIVNHRGQVKINQNSSILNFEEDLLFTFSDQKSQENTLALDESDKLNVALKNNSLQDSKALRIKLLSLIWDSFTGSLKNDHGKCNLNIKSDGELVGFEDFKFSERTANDQAGNSFPGSRLEINKQVLGNPSWELICKDDKGEPQITKAGTYLYLFFDVFLNEKEGHYSYFSISMM